jgi:hypothetical protein
VILVALGIVRMGGSMDGTSSLEPHPLRENSLPLAGGPVLGFDALV